MIGCRARRLARHALLFPLLLLAPGARDVHAEEVRLPVGLEFPFLRDTLVRQVYTEPGPSAHVLDDAQDCGRLTLADPRLDAREGRLRLRTLASARLGTMVLGRCTLPLDWGGEIELLLEPVVSDGASSVRFRVVDSNVRKPDGSRAQIAGPLWSWIKDSVHPRLQDFHVDLAAPMADLRAFLPLVLPGGEPARTQRLVDSVALRGARVTESGMIAELRFAAPDSGAESDAKAAPEPQLSDEEIARLHEKLDRWDAFLTFVLKHAGRDTPAEQGRRELLAILLDAREELVDALEDPIPGRDPVRALFVSVWTRLSSALRKLGGAQSGEGALRYLSFVTAADALAALDRLGPGSGVEVSSAGLRRLARMLAPTDAADPLAVDDAVDLELRELFEFGAPIEPPPPEEESALPLMRATWAPVQRTPTAVERLRLRGWAPGPGELDDYLALVHVILDDAAERMTTKTMLDARFQPIYGWLVLAAAWKESCWRQVVSRDGRPVPLRSTAGAVGILQVNVRVWRGFYEPRALERDLPYNASAGAEILARYLLDYAIPGDEHGIGGSLDALARATYAAYNGGPRALARWRKPHVRADLRKIDDAFWRDYRTVKATGEPDRATCYGA